VLSPEEEREFWSAVGANDVSREKLSRVLDRLASLLVLYRKSRKVGTDLPGLRIRSIFGRIWIQQITILKTGSGSYWRLPRINSNI